ncbi:hypothetical protein [Anaerospora hongkongensis]|uniref:hypothetical protein n=1 Tax=Anaerospora hongkongensis TaxID=244830 RepID=UPI002899F8E0|nr:hypothetical protein [Anaerospora hongkongensis]
MDFVHWLLERVGTFSNPFGLLLWGFLFISMLFSITASPFNTVAGFSVWVAIMYHLYKRE